jgi:hypothetical protein
MDTITSPDEGEPNATLAQNIATTWNDTLTDPADDDAPLARFAVAIGTDEREWIGFHDYDRALRCAVGYGLGPDFIHDRHRELLHESVSYGIQWRPAGSDWTGHVTSSALHSTAEADDYIADMQALAGPGLEVRAVEIRLTHTALPAPAAAQPSDVDHGPVAARTLRSGCRIDLHGAERLVWKVEYMHAGNYLRVHTVPPVGEHPDYFTFTLMPHDRTELVSRGPAVDVAGEPVDTTR